MLSAAPQIQYIWHGNGRSSSIQDYELLQIGTTVGHFSRFGLLVLYVVVKEQRLFPIAVYHVYLSHVLTYQSKMLSVFATLHRAWCDSEAIWFCKEHEWQTSPARDMLSQKEHHRFRRNAYLSSITWGPQPRTSQVPTQRQSPKHPMRCRQVRPKET